MILYVRRGNDLLRIVTLVITELWAPRYDSQPTRRFDNREKFSVDRRERRIREREHCRRAEPLQQRALHFGHHGREGSVFQSTPLRSGVNTVANARNPVCVMLWTTWC